MNTQEGLAQRSDYSNIYVFFFPYDRKIQDAKARAGCVFSPPDVLMKVLSGNIVVSLSLCSPDHV